MAFNLFVTGVVKYSFVALVANRTNRNAKEASLEMLAQAGLELKK
jgi:hypothetical protein